MSHEKNNILVFYFFDSIPLTIYQSPKIKFKLLEIFADRVKLSQDFMSNDSLNLVLCGSRSPLAAPGRAETCFIVKFWE